MATSVSELPTEPGLYQANVQVDVAAQCRRGWSLMARVFLHVNGHWYRRERGKIHYLPVEDIDVSTVRRCDWSKEWSERVYNPVAS